MLAIFLVHGSRRSAASLSPSLNALSRSILYTQYYIYSWEWYTTVHSKICPHYTGHTVIITLLVHEYYYYGNFTKQGKENSILHECTLVMLSLLWYSWITSKVSNLKSYVWCKELYEVVHHRTPDSNSTTHHHSGLFGWHNRSLCSQQLSAYQQWKQATCVPALQVKQGRDQLLKSHSCLPRRLSKSMISTGLNDHSLRSHTL